MAEGRVTPEKELLKLIEGSKVDGGAQIQAEAVKRKVSGIFSFGALIGRISFFKDWLINSFKTGKFYLDIKALNKFLKICIFILGIYFIANFTASLINSRRILNLELKTDKANLSLNLPEVSLLKPAVYYLEKAKSRNIFSMHSETQVKEAEVKAEILKINELAQNLKLVGISWSDNPDIIIEDMKLQQTFFLKKGNKINDLTIKEVFKDRIILSYEGKEIELR